MVVEVIMLFFGEYMLKDFFKLVWNMVWGTCLLMTCLAYGCGKCNRFLVMLGNISYSMYMVHFLLIGFATRILIDNSIYSVKNTVMVVLSILAVIPISYAAYKIWEIYIPAKVRCWVNAKRDSE